jgi:hypothetical protein
MYLVAPHSARFPAAAVGVLAFAAVLMILPAVRPIRQPVLCPLNWTLLVFFVQLVVVPLLLSFFGPFPNTLPLMPTDHDINLAILMSAGSFVAFAVGCELYSARRIAGPRHAQRVRKWRVSPLAVLLFAALGVLGFLISFGSIAKLTAYYESPENYVGITPGTANSLLSRGALAYTVGLMLKPFLGFAIVIAWCAWAERSTRRHTVALVVVTLAAGLAIAVSFGTFSYNRGTFVAPLISLAAVYGNRVRRIRLWWIVVAGVISILLLAAFQAYRSSFQDPRYTGFSLQQAIGDPQVRQQILQETDVNDLLQVYGGGPQYLAFLLKQTDYAADIHYGKTTLSSILYPVPVLGRPFRASSGVQIYNQLIYGRIGQIDQVVPFQGELYLDFHLPGVIIGYLLLGIAVMFLQRRFLEAPTALQSFVWQYTATWLAFLVIGSIAVVSQVLIYFFLPIYALAAWSWIRPKDRPI